MRWFTKAALQGHISAQYYLGKQYATGKGIPRDTKQAATWYINAGSQGHSKATEALMHLALKEVKEAQEWTIAEAKKGVKEAQYILGQMYEQGTGVKKKDEEKAAKWYIKAAKQEYKNAAYALQDFALKGNNFAQQWLIKKATKGDKEAQYILGQIYEQGIKLDKNEDKAIEWYIKAVHRDYPFAGYNLRNLALKGNKLAQRWIIEIAEKEDQEVQYTIGKMYEQGTGVKKDKELSAGWYVKAANQLQAQAPDALYNLALGGSKIAQEWLLQEAETGNKEAQYTLAQIHEQGIGLKKDENHGIE